MTKPDIIRELTDRHERFASLITSMSEADFLFSANGKWSAGQQLEHIHRTVQPLVSVLRLPKFVLRLAFGMAKRSSRDYDALVAKYHAKLASGGKAPRRYIPLLIAYSDRESLRSTTLIAVHTICQTLERYSETDLDRYVLPHPLLGKLTLREMMYFTAYHVEHHQAVTMGNLANR